MRGTGTDSWGNEFSGRSRGSVVQSGRIEQLNMYAAESAPFGPPMQLPPPTPLFMGRGDDLAWFGEQWRRSVSAGAGALFVVSGTAGVGKTSLALAWLHDRAEEFPDGQLYADLSGYTARVPDSPAEVLSGFLRALGIAPERVPMGLAERVALFRTVTRGIRVCVLLDNAVSAAQVRVLTAASQGCATVVTTRGTIGGLMMDGARFRRVEPWSSATGAEFVERALGDERSAMEPEAVQRVVELCGGLPLALSVAAARLASRPRWQIGRLAEALERDGARLEALAVGEDAAVLPALDGSYRVLDEESGRLYRVLGWCPVVWFDAVMVAAVLDCRPEFAESQLELLVDANLLEEFDGRYRFHDLVRLHAAHCAEQSPATGGKQQVLARLTDYLLLRATAAETLLTPSHRILERRFLLGHIECPCFDGENEALAWLERERPNLMAVLRYCASDGMDSVVWQLADAMWPLFLRLNYVDDRLEALELAVRAAEAEGEEAAEASLQITLAAALRVRGQPAEAERCCRRSLELYRRLGNFRGQGQACHGLGKLHAFLGEFDRAQPWFAQALELWEQADYRRGMALAYQGLGRVAAACGDPGAEELLRRSHEGLLLEGDSYDAAWSMILRARVLKAHGELDLVLYLLDEAATRMSAAGSTYGQATALEGAGQVHETLGAMARAYECYTQAETLFARCEPAEAERVGARLAGRVGPEVDQATPIPPG